MSKEFIEVIQQCCQKCTQPFSAFTDIVVPISTVITPLTAVITAFIAANALRSWGKEHKGKARWEVARRVLITSYQLVDGLKILRNKNVINYSVNNRINHAEINELPINKPAFEFEIQQQIKEERIKPFAREIQTLRGESKVICGDEFSKAVEEMFELFGEMEGQYNEYYHLNFKQRLNEEEKKRLKKLEDLIWSSTEEKVPNIFDEKIKKNLENIEIQAQKLLQL